jgi:hypothetical protein
VLGALAALLRPDPALAERTMAMLRDDLACPDLEEPTVRDEVPTSVRLPADLVRRLDALIPRLERVPALAALGPLTRSKVLRLALVRGVETLEVEHGKGKA